MSAALLIIVCAGVVGWICGRSEGASEARTYRQLLRDATAEQGRYVGVRYTLVAPEPAAPKKPTRKRVRR